MIEIKSKEIKQILVYFLFNQQKKVYSSEIANLLDLDVSNTGKALNKIVKEGILKKEKRGGHWFYCLNKDYPMFSEVKKIILFKYGLDVLLKKKLKKLKGIEEAYIYGSYAKGGLEAESDIDILLIGNHSVSEALGIFLKLQKYFGREFNSFDMDREEFEKKIKNKDDFLRDIFNNEHIRIL
ncbi:MAG: nucleotidyltransferase domain-containing protein [Patescibacteria group bacterium]|nr:nucleotidyltransferase domain-containing protein [Patescibacteria group bacterium]